MRNSSFLSFKKTVLTPVLFMGLTACYQTNPRKMTPPEVVTSVNEKNEVTFLKKSNAVDILFVIDNSDSMAVHQENLAANIKYFVEAFNENETLDYHIGITPIFDSVRYGKEIKTFNPNGALLPLNGEVGNNPRYYYTRAHNDMDLLAKSIHIGVLPLKNKDNEYQGPEFEEILSPVFAALNEPIISSETNRGFYRPDARLAVIMITDADDSSPGLSGGDLDSFLRHLKNDPLGQKISTFGVLARRSECPKVDYGMPKAPERILDFIEASQGAALSLCKGNFAEMLSNIGQQIERKSSKQVFRLENKPEAGTIKLFVGDKEIPPGPRTWQYNSRINAVVVTATPKDDSQDIEVPISIRYVQTNMQNQINGRARRFELTDDKKITEPLKK